MKLTIFCDMDGVFNIYAGAETTNNQTDFYFEESLIRKFDDLVDDIDCDLVISSSWRDEMDYLQRQLERVGFRNWSKVRGRTAMKDKSRGELILDYCECNDIEHFVILDDCVDNIKCQDIEDYRIIQTSAYTGISDFDINQIRKTYMMEKRRVKHEG